MAAKDLPPDGGAAGAGAVDVAQPAEGHDETALPLRTGLLVAEIALLREALGRLPDERPAPAVADALPHEVRAQALAVLRRTDRLCFEVAARCTRFESDAPGAGDAHASQARAHAAIDAALAQVRAVKARLGIDRAALAAPGAGSGADDAAEPDDTEPQTRAFTNLLDAARALDRLLERPTRSSDAYLQTTRAVAHASALLARFPRAERLPRGPALRDGATPADVQQALEQAFARARRIAVRAQIPMLARRADASSTTAATPGDNADLAALIVAELGWLHGQLPGARTDRVREAWFPGYRTPAQVLQRVGVLDAQLAELERLLERGSGWREARSP